MAGDELRELERAILGDIWTTDEPYRVLRELCDNIGHRFGGSESERQGAEFLRDKMLAYGLQNVRIEEFPMAGWERGAASLRLRALRGILRYAGEELVEEPFRRLIPHNQLLAYRYTGFWACMDTFKDKQRFDDMEARGETPWQVWRSPSTNA